MADSTLIIDRDEITTFADDTRFSYSDINDTITEICDKFDAMLETATGHSHDGTDSRAVSSTVAGLTLEEYAIAQIGGFLD